MNKFYSINIQKKFATVLLVQKKKDKYHVLKDDVLDLDEVEEYLQDKKSLYIIIDVEELIEQDVTLPSAVQQKSAIKAYIIRKIKESLSSPDIILHYHKISQNKEDDTTLYNINAVYESQYTEKLNLIDDWQKIQSASITKFALLNLSKQCFDYKKHGGYFFVFTQGNVVSVLAIDHEGTLLLKRSNMITTVAEMRYMQMVEEINQTINYAKQQFREVQFSTILLSGSMTLDDVIAEHLFVSNNLAIGVVYPNTFIKGLEREEPQNYITSIGAFFIEKKDQFLPDKLLRTREYTLATNLSLLVASLLFMFTSYTLLDKYIQYTDTTEQYENIKNRLVRMTQEADKYSFETLQSSAHHLEVAQKFLSHSPIDATLQLKPLIQIIKPSQFSFFLDEMQEPNFQIEFEKKFTTLEELYNTQNNFYNTYQELNKEKNFEITKTTDYSNLLFKITIINKVQTQEENEEVPGERTL